VTDTREWRLARDACHAAYDEHSTEYAHVLDPTLAGIADRLAACARVSSGGRALDLATGTGAVARALARRGASVVAVDRSAAMIELARATSPGIELLVADAHELPFEDRAFDAVTGGLALSHFRDPLLALREAVRVLRPGGHFAASTWGHGGGTPSSALIVELLARGGAADTGYTLDEQTWLDPTRGSELLREAGLVRTRVDAVSFAGRFADVEHALAWTLAWPCGSARLARLDARARETFVERARSALGDTDLSWSLAFNVYTAER
jgi:SAM-dependent methyltransferase